MARFLFTIPIVLLVACAAPGEDAAADASSEAFDAGVALADAGAAGPDASTLPGVDAGPASSHGHGGLACSSTGTVSSGGTNYTFCVATVAGVELKIVEPDKGTVGPLRLAVYLHGDGAGPYNSGLALRKLAPWTAKHHALLVAARAPNACAWWLSPSYTTCDSATPVPDSAIDRKGENAQALKSVIATLRAGWDILDSPVLFGGSSGGSIFLTASFFPLFGDGFPGSYALSCGGARPWAGQLAWEGHNPALVGGTKLAFTYGDKDFVVPDVVDALAFYQGLGIPTDVKVVAESVAAGTSHCGNVGGSYSYDQIGRVSEVWAAYLGEP